MPSRSKPRGMCVNTISQLRHLRMSNPPFWNRWVNAPALQMWHVAGDSAIVASALRMEMLHAQVLTRDIGSFANGDDERDERRRPDDELQHLNVRARQ